MDQTQTKINDDIISKIIEGFPAQSYRKFGVILWLGRWYGVPLKCIMRIRTRDIFLDSNKIYFKFQKQSLTISKDLMDHISILFKPYLDNKNYCPFYMVGNGRSFQRCLRATTIKLFGYAINYDEIKKSYENNEN